MNEAQRQYLKLLSEEAGEPFDPSLDEDAAERRIGELRIKTGRGVHEHAADTPTPPATSSRSPQKRQQREDVFPPPQSRG